MSGGMEAPARFEFVGIDRQGARARVLVETDLGVLRVCPTAYLSSPHFAALPTDEQERIRDYAARVSSMLR